MKRIYKTILAGALVAGALSSVSCKSKRETEPLAQKEREDQAKAIHGTRAGELKVFTIASGVDVKFRWCPPTGSGGFTMGSPTTEKDRFSEKIQHKVVLSKGFWMGETEVTQRLWKAVMGSNPSDFKKGDDYPVEFVSWDDVQEFIRKVNQSGKLPKGLKAVLPTEAQWEYACRAGSTGAYAGSGKLDEMGWYRNSANRSTHPVGQKKANAWGLKDMHGNVWEWCSNWYEKEYPRGVVTDPIGASGGSFRVIRGGSWDAPARRCRSANRLGFTPDFRCNFLGFRLSLQSVSK